MVWAPAGPRSGATPLSGLASSLGTLGFESSWPPWGLVVARKRKESGEQRKGFFLGGGGSVCSSRLWAGYPQRACRGSGRGIDCWCGRQRGFVRDALGPRRFQAWRAALGRWVLNQVGHPGASSWPGRGKRAENGGDVFLGGQFAVPGYGPAIPRERVEAAVEGLLVWSPAGPRS